MHLRQLITPGHKVARGHVADEVQVVHVIGRTIPLKADNMELPKVGMRFLPHAPRFDDVVFDRFGFDGVDKQGGALFAARIPGGHER